MRDYTAVEAGEWLLGISSWVIQDGNYVDFEVGQQRRFAIEYHADELTGVVDAVPSVSAEGDGRYAITARVAFADRDVVVIDFGLLAYTDFQPPAVEPGAMLRGRVFLEVDKFSYFESHARRERMPPAVYTWTITGIWRQTAPLVPGQVQGIRALIRDPSRLGWAWLDRTDAWFDDEGHAEYMFRCRLEAEAPGFRV